MFQMFKEAEKKKVNNKRTGYQESLSTYDETKNESFKEKGI